MSSNQPSRKATSNNRCQDFLKTDNAAEHPKSGTNFTYQPDFSGLTDEEIRQVTELFKRLEDPSVEETKLDLGQTQDPLFVKLESFFDFSFSLSEELEALVEEQREFSRTLEWNEWEFEYQLRKEKGELSEKSNLNSPK